ncbi:DNA repair protein complementing XP-G cells homolog isoform X2 [Polypterus senegalus]|uniref:DNA repair protein complementing XP-G cells homolog isoform X2 n=1 Tax=Polypterus senegalus TaxID=55291 RepID=UPI00196676D7|nr:DNA repair protein complementing XP-G cells homolog isoform X2 [Polypterus senegalus]
MGVQGLWKLLESTGRPINPETLEGRILAVDISIWLNQAVKGIRDREGNAVQHAHLLTLFNRLCKLLFFKIKPIFVFDGDAPLLKLQTLAIRRQRKEDAAKESRQTSEKLLKTFLKRQAIKATLGDKSQDVLPSISSIRREEVDDTYNLPPLQDQERNSYEEEAERDWEEMSTNRKNFQEHFFEDPNSIDIDSEEFTTLPAEIKHEILKDMKEFSKRRRTLFEAPPEKSSDFSQYQLAGLLKRNNLNQRIENVEKEMNHQTSGLIQNEFGLDGVHESNMETRRLVSEDTSHYILIKGAKKNEEVAKENETVHSKASTSTLCGTFNKKQMPLWSPVTQGHLSDSTYSSHAEKVTASELKDENNLETLGAPPSPRTLLAIQSAMEDSYSDEDFKIEGTETESKKESVCMSHNHNKEALSPRTLLAIQKALSDNEEEIPDLHCPSNQPELKKEGSICSSNEDKKVIVEIMHEKRKKSLTVFEDDPFPKGAMTYPEISETTKSSFPSEPKHSSEKVFAINVESVPNEDILKTSSEASPNSHSTKTIKDTTVLSPANLSQKINDHIKLLSTSDHSCNADIPENLKKENIMVSFSSQTLKQDLIYTKNVDMDAETEQSDSEESFIEVSEESSSEPIVQLSEEAYKAPELHIESAPSSSMPSHLTISKPETMPSTSDENCDEEVNVNIQNDSERDKEKEDKPAWEDITLEELEVLERNLSMQQSSLQQQKQQQERVAKTVTGQMYLESQELLRLFGIPFIVAPMEAEAQCAFLDITDQTSGTITDDSDIWLFGARNVYKNFFNQNKYVENYQLVDLQNQLGLNRSKLINLAYLLGSDYTEGIPGVGYVTGMEILNEFPGPGLEPLIKFSKWFAEAQENKKIRENPNDTRVKKKLRHLKVPPYFPNTAVQVAYLKPVVDDCHADFSWGTPDLDLIKEFCGSRFGWSGKKTDDILLPVMKQLNAHQTQLRIDSFFRLEQHEKQAIKSQRLRRAVTCLKRKKWEGKVDDDDEEEEGYEQTEKANKSAIIECCSKTEVKRKDRKTKEKKSSLNLMNEKIINPEENTLFGGGFLVSSSQDVGVDNCEGQVSEPVKYPQGSSFIRGDSVTTKRHNNMNIVHDTPKTVSSSSSDDTDEDRELHLVSAKPVFTNQRVTFYDLSKL